MVHQDHRVQLDLLEQLVHVDLEEILETQETRDQVVYKEIEDSLDLLVLMERWDRQEELVKQHHQGRLVSRVHKERLEHRDSMVHPD